VERSVLLGGRRAGLCASLFALVLLSTLFTQSVATAANAITEEREERVHTGPMEDPLAAFRSLEAATQLLADAVLKRRAAENEEAEHQHVIEVSVPPPKTA
jgi:hypothetical protein